MSTSNFLTPQELIYRYPQVNKLDWTNDTLTKLYNAGMLEGYSCIDDRQTKILESSFVSLFNYAMRVSKKE